MLLYKLVRHNSVYVLCDIVVSTRWATVATIDMGRKEGGLLCPFRE